MSTISREIAEQIAADDGYFMDDPRVLKVVKYENAWGGESWAIVYPHQNPMMYEESHACKNVTVLWEAS